MKRRTFIQAAAALVSLLTLGAFGRAPKPISKARPLIPVTCWQRRAAQDHDVRECGFMTPECKGMTIVSVHFNGHQAVFHFQPIEIAGVIPYHEVSRTGS